MPSFSLKEEHRLLNLLKVYATQGTLLTINKDQRHGHYGVLDYNDGRKAIVKPIHPLLKGNRETRLELAMNTGINNILFAPGILIDRQPFFVWQQLIEKAR